MKKLCLIISIAVLLPFCLFGCEKKEELNFYHITATFNEENMSLNCTQDINFVNKGDNAISEVSFFVYANAFDEGQTPVAKAYYDRAYPDEESFGRCEILGAWQGEIEAEFLWDEPQKNILNVKLKDELYPNESVSLRLEYCIYLANINHRLGYGDNTVNFGNFFPIACVQEEGVGFVKNKFVSNGDPFYSECANFQVEISFPEEYKIAHTGVLVSDKVEDGQKQVELKAENVRDFCFSLSKKFSVLSGNVEGVEVNYFYYDDERASQSLQTSLDAVKTFCELFGKYPYQKLDVVKANFCYGGMEYPNLVLISDAVENALDYDYVIIHEIAHQWWYSVVGNNEYDNAWVDEGLTEFSTALFFKENPSYNVDYNQIISNAQNGYKTFVDTYTKVLGDVDESMNRTLSEFDTEPEYVQCTYTKGMLMFATLKSFMSESKFSKCLKNYYKDYAFKNSSAEKLIESFSKSARTNLESFFRSWLDGSVKIGA